MTCPNHVTTQTWCRQCCADVVDSSHVHLHSDRRGLALPPPSLITPEATSRHDASAARIAGLEANVNEQLGRIAALESELAALQSAEWRTIAAAREAQLMAKLRDVLALHREVGGYLSPRDQQRLRDARAMVEG